MSSKVAGNLYFSKLLTQMHRNSHPVQVLGEGRQVQDDSFITHIQGSWISSQKQHDRSPISAESIARGPWVAYSLVLILLVNEMKISTDLKLPTQQEMTPLRNLIKKFRAGKQHRGRALAQHKHSPGFHPQHK